MPRPAPAHDSLRDGQADAPHGHIAPGLGQQADVVVVANGATGWTAIHRREGTEADEPRQFEYALVVAEEGSVTAAELLHVAQLSVSQQIRGLEREFGVELFTRTPTGLVSLLVRSYLRATR
ncbi:hypothetical protein GCM10010319_23980 [Streptomyces blastmyceticus]|uniref:HTH lysR-type domain-containing protein n=1 Tax=Streptomyces blastmyceticus TaxID=68180 RepID=A0ABP3GM92_9ACTN